MRSDSKANQRNAAFKRVLLSLLVLMGRFDAITGNFHLVTEGQKLPVTQTILLSFLSLFLNQITF